jgi:nucleoside phosphorylase
VKRAESRPARRATPELARHVEKGAAVPDILFSDCRAAARAVHSAECSHEVLEVVRPRSMFGLVRSRAPISIGLLVAAAEGRLIWRSPQSFALLERPAAISYRRPAHGPLLTLLRAVDRRWDWLVFAIPPSLTLTVCAVLLASTGAALVVAWIAAVAAGYVTVFMAALALSQMTWARRVLGARQPSADEIAEETLPGWNWSIPLLHQARERGGTHLLDMATLRMRQLVRADIRHVVGDLGGEGGSVPVREVLVLLTRGVTTRAMRQAVVSVMHKPYGPDARVVLRPPTDPVRTAPQPAREAGGFLFHYVAGAAVILTICAYLVSRWELANCARTSCAGRPATFGSAGQWLAWRLLVHDPTGIVPATPQAVVIGWLTSLVGIMALPVAYVSVRLALAARRRAIQTTVDYVQGLIDRTRVLLLTVTPVERDAVLAAICELTGDTPERTVEDRHVVYELGTLPTAKIAMVQSPRTGATGPGGATLTTAEVISRWRPDVVVMVGTCFGLREDGRHPQALGDVVVSSVVADTDRRAVFDGNAGAVVEETQGDRVPVPTGILSRLLAASTDWHTATVHFGLVLASGALVSSHRYRSALRDSHRQAIAGEMEGHGVYAAATEAGIPWVLVKGISDWGYDRNVHYEPELAAGNAASFVAHTLRLGAFDGLVHR